MVARRGDIVTVAELLGHAWLDTTRRCTQPTSDQLATAVGAGHVDRLSWLAGVGGLPWNAQHRSDRGRQGMDEGTPVGQEEPGGPRCGWRPRRGGGPHLPRRPRHPEHHHYYGTQATRGVAAVVEQIAAHEAAASTVFVDRDTKLANCWICWIQPDRLSNGAITCH